MICEDLETSLVSLVAFLLSFELQAVNFAACCQSYFLRAEKQWFLFINHRFLLLGCHVSLNNHLFHEKYLRIVFDHNLDVRLQKQKHCCTYVVIFK